MKFSVRTNILRAIVHLNFVQVVHHFTLIQQKIPIDGTNAESNQQDQLYCSLKFKKKKANSQLKKH